MMNHEHNPVAVRIGKLQKEWSNATEKQPAYTVARWVIYNEDIDFLNGFLKLESSPHGSLDEVFVALFTPFSTPESFAKSFVADWIEMYRQGLDETPQQTVWGFQSFKDRLEKLPLNDTAESLMAEMLHDFSRYASLDTRNLVITLLPRSISDNQAYVKWLAKFLTSHDFSSTIKFSIVDYVAQDYFASIHKEEGIKSIAVNVPDLNMRGAVSELAAMGNPNDPQVQFRICMTKMGEATGKNKRADLDHWGAKLLEAGQRTGDQGTYASAYLIYGGFLMHFPAKEESYMMLAKAEAIAKRAVKQDEKNAVILIQIYGYMGALASMHKEHKEALQYFVKQADLANQYNLPVNAISAYKTIIYLCHTHGYTEEYAQYTEQGYQAGLLINDEELSVSDFTFIAYHYRELNHYNKPDEVKAMNERMEQLFGVNWHKELQQTFAEVEKQK